MVRHSSRIELKQSALKANVNFIKKKIGKKAILSSVVKANAYGHGIESFVPMAEKCGIHHFSVASSFEAEEVLQACNEKSEIMIMGIIYEEDIPWAIENNIEFFVYNYDRLPIALAAAQKVGKKAKVHIEVETGANRTGMPKEEFPKAITFLKKNQEHLVFQGLCTHFGGAESLSNQFKIDKQKIRYKEFLKVCKEKKYEPNIRHVGCSAVALAMPDAVYDLVRVGVSQYGFWPARDIYYHHLKETDKKSDGALKRIFSWKTDIMDVREVPEGDFIGYGTAFQASHKMKIAVMPLGYSNGYPRALSNRGYVLISGKKAPIVGLINMNLFMVDITHIPDAKVGDEVVLIGRQKNNVINVSSFTDSTQLLNNEMLSRLPSAIPRTIVKYKNFYRSGMNFTEYEQEVIKELEQRAGDVLYFEDFAPYFISKSLLQLSTYTHTAYIQLGEKMQTALSEYFQLIVFIRKMEANGACFSISYTPLEDNSVLIGQRKYSDYQQHTIADGDLLIQLFQYAAKKYVMAAKISEQFVVGQRPARNNFIIPSMVLLLLFIFIGAMAYQSYQDRNILKMQQEAIEADLEKQTESIELLTEQFEAREKVQNQLNADMRQEINLINQSLVKQNKSLRSVRYWNKQQYDQLEKLIENLRGRGLTREINSTLIGLPLYFLNFHIN